MATDHSIALQQSQALTLPVETGTIEFRDDGSTTVAGHRVRLKRVVELVDDGLDLARIAELLPTIEAPLLAKVLKYISRHRDAIDNFMRLQEQVESVHAAAATHVSLQELRRRASESH